MAYFGSTIEGAAGTALQAANSIADREAASAWQRYNAMAQQQAQAANMEQMRFANQQAMRQAAESDYWRRKQAAEEASRYQTALGMTREQMAQQAAERADALKFKREEFDAAKEMRDMQLKEWATDKEVQKLATKSDWDQVMATLDELKGNESSLNAKISKAVADASSAVPGTIFDPRSRTLQPPKGMVLSRLQSQWLNNYNADIKANFDALQQIQYNLKAKDIERQRIENMARAKSVDLRTATAPVMGVDSDMSQNQLPQQYQFKAPPMNFTQFERVSPERISLMPSWIPQTPEAPANYVGTPVASQPSITTQVRPSAGRNYDYWFQGPLTKDRYVKDFAGWTLDAVREPVVALEEVYDAGKEIDRSIIEATGTPYRAGLVGRAWDSFLGTPIENDPTLAYPAGAVPSDRRRRFLARGGYFNQTPATAAVPVAPPTVTVTNRTAVPRADARFVDKTTGKTWQYIGAGDPAVDRTPSNWQPVM